MSKPQLSIAEIQSLLQSENSEGNLETFWDDPRIGVQRLLEKHLKLKKRDTQEQIRMTCLLTEEKKLWQMGWQCVAGVDEAGRGPLAGPVFAGACILPAQFDLPALNDSKKLNKKQRELLFGMIQEQALAYAVASASPEEIDQMNILQASKLAMRRAIEGLDIKPDYLLIDALKLPEVPIPQTGLTGGDGLSASIAAASVLAKVARDRFMGEMHQVYPEYDFAKHKGYPTSEHMQMLRQFGPCPIHRRTFAPVAAALAEK